ncbi:hypothetical protein KR018_007677, partial [Drosophila ironensis]
ADPMKPYGFNLWKSTRNIKRQPLRKIPIRKTDNWCRSDSEIAIAFADELEKRFQPFDLASSEEVEETMAFINAPSPDALPIQHVSPEEVCLQIRKLHPNKEPGFDGIDTRVARALPKKGILFLVLLFNAMLRIHHFPSQWKCAVITMIPKPGKPENLGNVLGPVLYTLYTSDLPNPTQPGTLLATYANDTAFLANSSCCIEASRITQEYLKSYGKWANRWNVAINGSKSQHCCFT